MEDENGLGSEILGVLASDLRFEGYRDIADVENHVVKGIQGFLKCTSGWNPASGLKSNAGKTQRMPSKS